MANNQEWKNEVKEYTERQWEDEMTAPGIVVQFPNGPFSFGRKLPCPKCGTVGFYGPRMSESEEKIIRKYRACKFCGFWQEVWGDIRNERGGEAYRCIAVYCDKCKKHDWRVPWANELGSCSDCHTKLKEIKWASDDSHHPFRKIKEQIYQHLGMTNQ